MDKSDELEEKIQKLEDDIKEREVSVFRAYKTLLEDLYAYYKGDKKELPVPAITGLVFAYIRPRVILMFGSILAVALAVTQTYLLLRQNDIIEDQLAQETYQRKIESINLTSFIRREFQKRDAEILAQYYPFSGKITGSNCAPVEWVDRANLPPMFRPANNSTIVEIVKLGREKGLEEAVQNSLNILTGDDDGFVAYAAMIALEDLGHEVPNRFITLRGAYLAHPIRTGSIEQLIIDQSFLESSKCESCRNLSINRSLIADGTYNRIAVYNSIIVDAQITASSIQSNIAMSTSGRPNALKLEIGEGSVPATTGCPRLELLCDSNPFANCAAVR